MKSTQVKIPSGKIIPISGKLKLESFRRDIEESHLSVVICFDLDGLYGVKDKVRQDSCGKKANKIQASAEMCSSSDFAGIARSQTPRRYVPQEIADSLQDEVLTLIRTIYNRFGNNLISAKIDKKPLSLWLLYSQSSNANYI